MPEGKKKERVPLVWQRNYGHLPLVKSYCLFSLSSRSCKKYKQVCVEKLVFSHLRVNNPHSQKNQWQISCIDSLCEYIDVRALCRIRLLPRPMGNLIWCRLYSIHRRTKIWLTLWIVYMFWLSVWKKKRGVANRVMKIVCVQCVRALLRWFDRIF